MNFQYTTLKKSICDHLCSLCHLCAILPAAVLMLTACNTDENDRMQPEDTHVEMQIILNVPTSVETKALTEAQENTLATLDVLVFLDNGAGNDETFLYTVAGEDPQPGSGSQATIRVPLKKSMSAERHRLVFLGNLRQELNGVKASFTETMSKEDVLAIITFDAFDKAGTDPAARIWDTTIPRYLPMWGESPGTYVITPTLIGTAIGTIQMLRSVAAVSILLNPDGSGDPQGFTHFILTEARIYNPYRQGHAVPDADKITRTPATVKADEPTLSAGFDRDAATFISWHSTPLTESTGTAGELYIAEAENTGSSGNIDGNKQTCLLISGLYNGAATPTWYRLDFVKEKDTYLRWDILRNHRYRFYITAVTGPGYETPEEAFESTPVNLTTEVVAWNEGDKIPEIDFEGWYNLKVSHDNFYFYRSGRAQKLAISSNHPGGWTADDPVDKNGNPAAWVTMTSKSGLQDEAVEVTIQCTDMTSWVENQREAWITIHSAHMRKIIHLLQENDGEFAVEVSPGSLTFRKSAPTAKSITVNTYPENSYVYLADIGGGNRINWLPGWGPLDHYGTLGVPGLSLDFRPAVNTSGNLLSGTVLVYIMDTEGNMVSEQVTISQRPDDYQFGTTPANPYPAQAGNHTLMVDSETEWSVRTDTSPAGMITYDNTAVYPAGDNTPFPFSLSANPTWANRTAILHPGSDDPDFVGEDIQIEQEHFDPALSVSPLVIDFGNTTAPGPEEVLVTSNAQWTVTGGAGFDVISSGMTPNPGGTNDPASPTQTVLTFGPVLYLSPASLPAAGEVITTATIETINHAPAASAPPVDVTLKRTIPAEFNFTDVPASIARTGGNAAVTASTNAAWYAIESTENKKSTDMPPAPLCGTDRPGPYPGKQNLVGLYLSREPADPYRDILRPHYGHHDHQRRYKNRESTGLLYLKCHH